ncbi:putative PurR-regulated permease PerM [Abditibacterium utsteinense]|uniref:Putative PurR-regulated permease PerM n=1 Tax=Abditibacterium utsteinense TaxID=1960156 RepID=A0A2S8SRK1_9BACT|nr:AI-2E family transporter [Abditibacterium utsteinense]PQV63417.1 putative PurR-regulated permease PerM [Abditibacterium utsteinense]
MISSPRPRSRPHALWSNRRILTLVALSTLLVSFIWRLPEELSFIGARTGELLFALTLAMAITYVLRPAVRAMTRIPGIGNTPRGRSLSALAVFSGCLLLCYLFFLIGFKPVQRDVKALVNGFWPRTPEERVALIAKWRVSLNESLEPYRAFLPAAVLDNPDYLPAEASKIVSRSGNWLARQSAHAGFIVELLLIPVLAFYFLADGPAIRAEAKLLFPPGWRNRIARMAEHFDFVLDGYVRGQAWMCIIAWALVTLTLWILGVPHAFTLGMIAGITRAVPVVGPLLGAIPLLFVTFFYTRSAQTTLVLGFAFTLMHFLESKVLLPKIVGHHVDLHPVSVIISLLIGLEFFGFIGVFLAVPIAAVLKIVLVEYHAAQAQKQAILAENASISVAAENAILQ